MLGLLTAHSNHLVYALAYCPKASSCNFTTDNTACETVPGSDETTCGVANKIAESLASASSSTIISDEPFRISVDLRTLETEHSDVEGTAFLRTR